MWLVVLVEQPQWVVPLFVSPLVNSVFLQSIRGVFLRGLASVDKATCCPFFRFSGKSVPIV